jgi:5'-deoxynucleotidase YfbR-like HD superfamily hydrolase
MEKKYFLKGIWEAPKYEEDVFGLPPSRALVKKDVTLILWSLRFQSLRRYFNQKFWEKESLDAFYSEKIDSLPRIESLSDHSWHVADMVLLIGVNFEKVDLGKCAQIAILHDKLELIMGDKNPLGRDGKGLKTHAFNEQKQTDKANQEREALAQYKSRLYSKARDIQGELFEELLEKKTLESRFLLAIDKLQPLAYILAKKKGKMENDHILFTLHYSRKAVIYFPSIFPYYTELASRLLNSVSRYRKIARSKLMEELEDGQMPLFL